MTALVVVNAAGAVVDRVTDLTVPGGDEDRARPCYASRLIWVRGKQRRLASSWSMRPSMMPDYADAPLLDTMVSPE